MGTRTSDPTFSTEHLSGDKPPDALDELLRSRREELAGVDLTVMSLLCADGLRGAERLDIPAYQARVKEWAALLRRQIPKYKNGFRRRPEDFDHSDTVFRASVLVTILKRDLGVHYNPDRIPLANDVACPLGFFDSRDLLIHGPLGPTRAGTCNNIPMAVVAVGRELGYPLYLATTPDHVYIKWIEPGGCTFNIEASNCAGLIRHPDSYYRTHPRPFLDVETRSGCYLRALTPAEELSLCLVSRAWVLQANGLYSHAAHCYIQSLVLWPQEHMYLSRAVLMVEEWLREAHNRSCDQSNRIPWRARGSFCHTVQDPRKLLSSRDAAVALTLLARYYEVNQRTGVAMAMYGEAFHLDPRGPGHVANLRRMIANVAAEPACDAGKVVPLRLAAVRPDNRFCLGLPLGFCCQQNLDPRAAALASDYGDKLLSLARPVEAVLAYGEAVRLDWTCKDYLAKRRLAAKMFVAMMQQEKTTSKAQETRNADPRNGR